MPKRPNSPSKASSINALAAELLAQYGPVMSGRVLCRALCYPTLDAMRQAAARRTLPPFVFKLPSRRGRHAFTRDVAKWLVDNRHAEMARS